MLEGINIPRFKSNSCDYGLPRTHLQRSCMFVDSAGFDPCQRHRRPEWTISLIQYGSSLYSYLFINNLQGHACRYIPRQGSIKCVLWLHLPLIQFFGGQFPRYGLLDSSSYNASLHIRLQQLMKAEAYVLSNSSQSGFSILFLVIDSTTLLPLIYKDFSQMNYE